MRNLVADSHLEQNFVAHSQIPTRTILQAMIMNSCDYFLCKVGGSRGRPWTSAQLQGQLTRH